MDLRKKLARFGYQIKDVKIEPENVISHQMNDSHSHVNYVANLIYFIPQVIKEEERVLYLDSDMIVNQDLSVLFDLDLGHYPIAAVNDLDVQTDLWDLGIKDTFNSGLVLFNLREIVKENSEEKLLVLAKEYAEQVRLGDQSILNIAFKDNWYHLDRTYNHLLVADSNWDIGDRRGHKVGKIDLDQLPAVLHYCAPGKPWNLNCWMQLKELWWYYYGLEWSQLVSFEPQLLEKSGRPQLLIVTGSGDLEQLENLLRLLPDFDIHLCAYTNFWSGLTKLTAYENLKLHPHVLNITLDDLLDKCGAYLDIHHGEEVYDSIQKMLASQKPVFAWAKTSHRPAESQVYEEDQLSDLVRDIYRASREH
ncbi:glycosyltransferase family 8 protein [Streptococcus oricebi]|uniref:Glycosyltransferase family 8 protein n=1 Tax=Streptococcus oricebi TaxID=1547447 RepID=A0ABS5B3B4_9STRE|nr:hypothetical protein [Streptococcus oricebi]